MKIGFLGTGLMGKPLAQRLLQQNFPVIAYNRTLSKVEDLLTLGGEIASDPLEVIEKATVIILMLSDAEVIKKLIFSNINTQTLENRTIIQMGTISPDESQEIQREIETNGGNYLEAPVLGSIPEAKAGTLLVMVGSTPAQFEQYQGIFRCFGQDPQYIGAVGTASTIKLALNQLIAALTSGFALSLGLIERQGVEIDKFMGILRESALYAPTFDKKLSRMCDRNFANPNFPTKHLLKDVNLFLTQAQQLGLNSEGLVGIREILEKTIELGLSDADYSALYASINPE